MMQEYIRQNIIAVYITDGAGIPTDGDILDWQGVSLLTGDTISVPAVIGTIPSQSLTQGGPVVTLPLSGVFSGATGYTISPATPGVSIVAGAVRIDPQFAVPARTMTVRASNAAGLSAPVTFSLTVAPLTVSIRAFDTDGTTIRTFDETDPTVILRE